MPDERGIGTSQVSSDRVTEPGRGSVADGTRRRRATGTSFCGSDAVATSNWGLSYLESVFDCRTKMPRLQIRLSW